MAIGDKVGKETVEEITHETIPAAQATGEALIRALVDGLHELLDRLDGMRLTIDVSIPPKGSKRG